MLNVKNELQSKNIDEIKEYYNETKDTNIVVALNIIDDSNIGTMIRTASLFGISEFHILGKRHYNRRPSVGMYNYIPVYCHRMTKGTHNEELDEEKIKNFLTYYKENNYSLVFIEQDSKSIHPSKMEKKEKTMFIFGNEKTGIPRSILDYFLNDTIVEFPQKGVGRSFNVSSTLSMILWEYYR